MVFTGLDGSGKGTQIAKTAQYLFDKIKLADIYLTREPSNGSYGQQIRNQILKRDKDPMKNARLCLDLYIKDREWHVNNVIKPRLEKGNVVICDRYYYETMTYQQTQGISIKEIIELNKKFPKPDIAFMIDVPASVAVERINLRGTAITKFENLEFMKKLRQNFLDLPKYLDDNIKVINGNQSIEEVFNEIKKELDRIF